MLEKIERLRTKPQHIRNRYAFWISFFITLLIVAIWGSTLPSRFAAAPSMPEENAEGESAWSRYTASFASMLENARSHFSGWTVENQASTSSSTEERIDLVEFVASSTASKEVATSTPSAPSATSTANSTATSSASSTASTTPEGM